MVTLRARAILGGVAGAVFVVLGSAIAMPRDMTFGMVWLVFGVGYGVWAVLLFRRSQTATRDSGVGWHRDFLVWALPSVSLWNLCIFTYFLGTGKLHLRLARLALTFLLAQGLRRRSESVRIILLIMVLLNVVVSIVAIINTLNLPWPTKALTFWTGAMQLFYIYSLYGLAKCGPNEL